LQCAGGVYPIRMQRIVFVTGSFGMGGTEKHLAELIERMDPAELDVVVMTMGLDPYTESLRRGRGPRVQVLPWPRGKISVSSSRRTFRSLGPAVIVFVIGDFNQFHWKMYVGARYSGARRVVGIEHLTATPPADPRLSAALRWRGGKWRGLARWVTGPLRRATTSRMAGLLCHETICVSDAVRDYLIREYGYPRRKTITLRNGVDVRHFSRNGGNWPTPPILTGRGGGPIAVCVSRLVPPKLVDCLIHAMKRVTARFPASRCVIVGEGPQEEELRSTVRRLEMEESVLFAGHMEDVRPYLAAGDIFVLPSEREGLPLSVLEAMAFGLPCVAGEAGGNREVIRDGVNGFVVPCRSAQALADAIERLFDDPKERVRMGKNARRIAEEEFDIEKSMAKVKSAILGGERVA
jgi:glycosyltransferase involved in cell wall biosynthesis